MRGTEVVARMRADGFRGAVVGFSANLTDELSELWEAAGCDAVLRKDSVGGGALVANVAKCCQTYGRSVSGDSDRQARGRPG
jgi:hypothetical protein